MPKLVIFDLDNTLINGDSDRNWGIYLSEKKIPYDICGKYIIAKQDQEDEIIFG